mgnify:CR=1 FL=1
MKKFTDKRITIAMSYRENSLIFMISVPTGFIACEEHSTSVI